MLCKRSVVRLRALGKQYGFSHSCYSSRQAQCLAARLRGLLTQGLQFLLESDQSLDPGLAIGNQRHGGVAFFPELLGGDPQAVFSRES